MTEVCRTQVLIFEQILIDEYNVLLSIDFYVGGLI